MLYSTLVALVAFASHSLARPLSMPGRNTTSMKRDDASQYVCPSPQQLDYSNWYQLSSCAGQALGKLLAIYVQKGSSGLFPQYGDTSDTDLSHIYPWVRTSTRVRFLTSMQQSMVAFECFFRYSFDSTVLSALKSASADLTTFTGMPGARNDDILWGAGAAVTALKTTMTDSRAELAQLVKSTLDTAWQGHSTDLAGGLCWYESDPLEYKNTITNSLFVDVAAQFSTLSTNADTTYLQDARTNADWILSQLVLNDGTVGDGRHARSSDTSLDTTQYTYNSGTVIEALVWLSVAPPADSSYLDKAVQIFGKAKQTFVKDNILQELCGTTCNQDQLLFPAIALRGLYPLAWRSKDSRASIIDITTATLKANAVQLCDDTWDCSRVKGQTDTISQLSIAMMLVSTMSVHGQLD